MNEGEDVDPETAMWRAFGNSFTPDKQIAAVAENAKAVVGNISLVGTVLAAGGLVAVTTVVGSPDARGWAIAAVALAAGGVLLAMLALLRWPQVIAVGNHAKLKSWFSNFITWRRWLVTIASILIVLAFGAGACAVVTVLNQSPPSPVVSVSATQILADDAAASVTVSATASVTALAADDVVTATLTAEGEPVAAAAQSAGADLKVEFEMSAASLSTDDSLEFAVVGGGWTCTATSADRSGWVVEACDRL